MKPTLVSDLQVGDRILWVYSGYGPTLVLAIANLEPVDECRVEIMNQDGRFSVMAMDATVMVVS